MPDVRALVARLKARLTGAASSSKAGPKVLLELADGHLLHSLLLVSLQLATSEREFYERTGWFKENVADLAAGVVRAAATAWPTGTD